MNELRSKIRPPGPWPELPPPEPVGTASATRWAHIDETSAAAVIGWIWDPSDPAAVREIELLDGDIVLLTLRADQFRQDLADAGIGTGCYGFSVHGLAALLPHARHLLRVRCAATKVDLPGSPFWVTPARATLDATAIAFLEHTIGNTIAAADAAEIDQALAAVIAQLTRLTEARHRLDAAAAPALETLLPQDGLGAHTAALLASTLQHYPPLVFEAAAAPLVSVIIPVHGKFATTYDCLRTILEQAPRASFEIIVVDDGSRDETIFASLLLSGGARLVRLPANGGFVTACNHGASLARGAFLLFLNNDTLVQADWLDTLVETFTSLPDIGIAGSALLFPDGSLQEAGGIVFRLADGANWGRHGDAAAPQFNFLRDADYVSGAALMIRKSLFDSLDGFDPAYAPAYYEDTDLCFRVRAAGLRVVVQPASRIVHLEGISNGTDPAGHGLKRYQPINQRKFFKRWEPVLRQHRMSGQSPELEAERLVQRRAYFIDDTILTPDQDAGSNAALQHIIGLQRLGYKVTFIPSDNMARIDPYTRNLEKIGVECLYAPYFWSVEEVFRKARFAPDLIYVHRISNASKYISLIRSKFPDCRILYSLADVHFLRLEREFALTGEDGVAVKAAAMRNRELTAMAQADCIVVHSPVECALLKPLLPGLPIEVITWAVQQVPLAASFAERSGYAFIGGFGHPPNVDAMLHFHKNILPFLPAPLADHPLAIAGSNMPPSITALAGPQVKICGFVPALTDIFATVRCTIAPLRYGAGIKGKVLESFAHFLPCVMSEIAAEGLPLQGDLTWLIARTDGEFAEKLSRLLTDEAWNHHLATCGLTMLQTSFSMDSMLSELHKAIS